MPTAATNWARMMAFFDERFGEENAVFGHVLKIAVCVILTASPLDAKNRKQAAPPAPVYDEVLYQALHWRCIGPFRGGRVTTVTGVPSRPHVYYMGATGGGVWRTEDSGLTWKCLSDGFFKTGSVGAIAVADADPNVVYAGMGEAQVRGVTTSHGDGVYKSTDSGATWRHLGLEGTRQISAVRVHPQNPDMAYVAAQGNIWKPNAERGVYRTVDGGQSWELVLHVSDRAGASDLSMDPNNPRILYAAFWEHQRLPWKVISGGPGSGLYKSVDGGDTWNELTEGLPASMGKIGVAVSPADGERVWAIVEAKDGGLYRSDNGGKKWTRVNQDRVLRARSWYYTKVFADPLDRETVYVLNAPVMRSIDGGKSFSRIATPHGDNHDLWIHPRDNRVMINGNDGGANVSSNGGKTWTGQANQPTAQFYRVIADNRFPYYVYGGQQDNSTVAIPSRTVDGGILPRHWRAVGGCESAHIAFDPDDPMLIYAGCYQGIITEYDWRAQKSRNVMAYPFLGLGSDPIDQKYRFNWNAPILTSPHDRNVIYHAGNVILKSEDRGHSWVEISPDLTRDQEEKQGKGGGPITNEAAGAETYNTLMYVVESPHQAGVIWAGSDDGLVHLTRDGGQSWQNVTPPGVGEAMINAIEVSPHDPAKAYLAVYGYKLGDMRPHVFKTGDYGQSWTKVVNGLGPESTVRVVREDPVRPGLLFAGAEDGLHLSFNDGQVWQRFQRNLPVCPVTDLRIKDGDLVAATQGRAFWILDDITPLRQLDDSVAVAKAHLFKPRAAYRMDGFGPDPNTFGDSPRLQTRGDNPPNGALIYYYFAEKPDPKTVKLEILDAEGKTVRVFYPKKETKKGKKPKAQQADGGDKKTSDAGKGKKGKRRAKPAAAAKPSAEQAVAKAKTGEDDKEKKEPEDERRRTAPLPVKAGMNRFVWDQRGEAATRVPKLFVFGSVRGHKLAPGTYKARLTVDDWSQEQAFELVQDPRRPRSAEAFREQQDMLDDLWANLNQVQESIKRMRAVRDQVNALVKRVKKRDFGKQVQKAGKALVKRIGAWEKKVAQPQQKTFQDVINFPNRLNAHFIHLIGVVDGGDPPVTAGARARFDDLNAEWQTLQTEMTEILGAELDEFNRIFREQQTPAVIVPTFEEVTDQKQ